MFYITTKPLTIVQSLDKVPGVSSSDGPSFITIANIEDLADLKTSLLIDIYNLLNHADPAADPTSRHAPIKVFQSKAKAIPRVWALMLGLLPKAEQTQPDAPQAVEVEGCFLLIYDILNLDKCLKVERYPDRAAANAVRKLLGSAGNRLNIIRIESEKDCGGDALLTSNICDILHAWGIEDSPPDSAAAAHLLFTTLVTKYNAIPFSEPPSDETTGDEDMAGKKRGAAAPRKVKATTERKVKEPSAPKERKAREKQPAGAGKAVRATSSLGRILELMLRGKYTMKQIVSMSKVEGGVVSAEDKVLHRINFILRTQHGIECNIDEAGIVSAKLPKGFNEETIFSAAKEKKAA